jgi:uncharacterized membrane protein
MRKNPDTGILPAICLFLGAAAYPWLVHQALTVSLEQRANYSLASAATLLLIVALLSAHSRYRRLLLCACLALGFFFYRYPTWLISHIAWLYLSEYSLFNCLLCFGFARSLTAGRTPMITQFAMLIRGSISPAIASYTRAITLAWAVFFGTLVLVSLTLFLLATHQIWSLFATILTPALVCAMFSGEYLIRLRLLPQETHEGFMATLRAVRTRACPEKQA